MNRLQNSKRNLFLLELMISISLFMLLLIVGLFFFIKAHNLTKKTALLHEAVTICSNVASEFENGDGSLTHLASLHPESLPLENQLLIFYDEKYGECDNDSNKYYLTVKINQTEKGITEAVIVFNDKDLGEVYSLTCCQYTQLQAKEDLP